MRPFLCNFNVCSYLIHRTFQNKNLLQYTYYQTYHFKMLSDRKCIIIYMYLKCVCIVMISTDGSMHNKRFIILNRRLLLHVSNCMQIHNTIMLFCVKSVFPKDHSSRSWFHPQRKKEPPASLGQRSRSRQIVC